MFFCRKWNPSGHYTCFFLFHIRAPQRAFLYVFMHKEASQGAFRHVFTTVMSPEEAHFFMFSYRKQTPSGHFTFFHISEHPREHFLMFLCTKKHPRGHFFIYSPLLWHPRKSILYVFLPIVEPQRAFYIFFHIKAPLEGISSKFQTTRAPQKALLYVFIRNWAFLHIFTTATYRALHHIFSHIGSPQMAFNRVFFTVRAPTDHHHVFSHIGEPKRALNLAFCTAKAHQMALNHSLSTI